MLSVLCVLLALAYAGAEYTVTLLSKGARPALSQANPVGKGFSPCEFTFNPAYIPAGPNVNSSFLIVRASGCPASFGGSGDHLLMAYCSSTGVCQDALPLQFPFESSAEDPRVFQLVEGGVTWTYLYYYASGAGQATVYLRRTRTPLDLASWELVVGALPWHRNGCAIVRESGPHYVFFGESPPLPGLGVATTTDFVSYTVLNSTWMVPNGANDTDAPEIVIEAGSTPVQLSTGDYLHLYAAGTPGWVKDGNYTGGWVIMDRDDPTRIVQKSQHHLFVPTMDYEIGMGTGPYPVNRNRTIFTTALVQQPGVDMFLVYCE
jgi:predicted GH43/DUF377 family glycosyl hydrolase